MPSVHVAQFRPRALAVFVLAVNVGAEREEGREFASSCVAFVFSISRTAWHRGRVTGSQMQAVANIGSGLNRWLPLFPDPTRNPWDVFRYCGRPLTRVDVERLFEHIVSGFSPEDWVRFGTEWSEARPDSPRAREQAKRARPAPDFDEALFRRRSCGQGWRDVLGVSFSAGYAEARVAYLASAKACHPDRPGGSVERMQAINVAWEAAQKELLKCV